MDQFIPKTYIINIDSDHFENELRNFLEIFLQLEQNSSLKNIWLLKPNDMNRGRGISLFNKLAPLYKVLKEYGKESIMRDQIKQISHDEYHFTEIDDIENQYQNTSIIVG